MERVGWGGIEVTILVTEAAISSGRVGCDVACAVGAAAECGIPIEPLLKLRLLLLLLLLFQHHSLNEMGDLV